MLMNDLKIQEMLPIPLEESGKGKKFPHDPLSDFKKILNKSIQETNHLLGVADQSTQEMVVGQKDVHQAMIALEQANLAFRLMIQVRNKMVSAYEEIMRMQV
jgi:flagellar hook-basal body complex protein FliE